MADPPQLVGACMDLPQLSPLSGAYLMIVVGEPFSEEHKQLILRKIEQGRKRFKLFTGVHPLLHAIYIYIYL